jgi:hypothetical protein
VERLREAAATPSGSRGPGLSSPTNSGATTITPGGTRRPGSSTGAFTSRRASASALHPSSSEGGGLSLRRGLHLGSSELQGYLRVRDRRGGGGGKGEGEGQRREGGQG